MRLVLTYLSLLWTFTVFAEPASDSFRITIRELKFPSGGEFVRVTQKRILKEINSGRSQLIQHNVWPVNESDFSCDSRNSLKSALFPPGLFQIFWNPILIGSKESDEVKISQSSLLVGRSERGKLVVGDDTWIVSVGHALSEYSSSVTVRGPKNFTIRGLNSKGLVEIEIWHGMSIMMITEDEGETTRQVFITIEEANDDPLQTTERDVESK